LQQGKKKSLSEMKRWKDGDIGRHPARQTQERERERERERE
jgi:hypothetical protein